MVMKLKNNTRNFERDLDKSNNELIKTLNTTLDKALYVFFGIDYSFAIRVEDSNSENEAKKLQMKQADIEITFLDGTRIYAECKDDYALNNVFQFEIEHTSGRLGWLEKATKYIPKSQWLIINKKKHFTYYLIDFKKLITLYKKEKLLWFRNAESKTNGFYFFYKDNQNIRGEKYTTKFIHVPITYIELSLSIKTYVYNGGFL